MRKYNHSVVRSVQKFRVDATIVLPKRKTENRGEERGDANTALCNTFIRFPGGVLKECQGMQSSHRKTRYLKTLKRADALKNDSHIGVNSQREKEKKFIKTYIEGKEGWRYVGAGLGKKKDGPHKFRPQAEAQRRNNTVPYEEGVAQLCNS